MSDQKLYVVSESVLKSMFTEGYHAARNDLNRGDTSLDRFHTVDRDRALKTIENLKSAKRQISRVVEV